MNQLSTTRSLPPSTGMLGSQQVVPHVLLPRHPVVADFSGERRPGVALAQLGLLQLPVFHREEIGLGERPPAPQLPGALDRPGGVAGYVGDDVRLPDRAATATDP